MNDVFSVLGQLGLTVTVAVGTAFTLFRWLGDKWISSKFEKELEYYKHNNTKEIEKLRFEINSLMDRAVRFKTREFDVLSEAWSKAWEAYRSALHFTSPIKRRADITKMDPNELKNYLNTENLHEYLKNKILNSENPGKEYNEAKYITEKIRLS
ncbi:hypothetical protein [Acuticoccus sediminis]|uniref:hypothetical protein n=1 Tax=Acuticoccus sediminis TaxID=2184697 RepID=UPI0011B94A23|nr:hypothetical protein [Acuticoccus sediminis]